MLEVVILFVGVGTRGVCWGRWLVWTGLNRHPTALQRSVNIRTRLELPVLARTVF